MPRDFPLPAAACTTTTAVSFPGLTRALVWFGLTNPVTASGSATWWGSNASGNGASLIYAMVAPSPGQTIPMQGPFFTGCGIYVNVVGGSAILWFSARP